MRIKILILSIFALFTFSTLSHAQDNSIAGTYRAVLEHPEEDDQEYHQFANITLRTVNTDGQLHISATVKMLYGDWASSEFLTYTYPNVELNILTRQLSIQNDENDVSFIGILGEGELNGEWFTSSLGRVGNFEASKNHVPTPAIDSLLIRSVSGYYRGTLVNTHPESNLPERVSMSLVSTQVTSEDGTQEVVFSGNMRFYLGDFGGTEYVETRLSDVQFDYYTRVLIVQTEQYGLTFRGTLDHTGFYDSDVYADGLGLAATAELDAM
jgi:hypothetical protein